MSRPTPAKLQIALLAGLPLSLALLPFDPEIYRLTLRRGVMVHDWYQVLRQFGNLFTWALIALVFLAADAARCRRERRPLWAPAHPRQGPAALHRAGLLLLSAGLSGAVAEAVKLLVGRSRPVPADLPEAARTLPALAEAPTGWGPFLGPFEHGPIGLGFPSSHAAVAFAGATTLALLLPGAGRALLPLALACAWTRLAAGAHSASDVAFGAVLGALAAVTLHRLAHPASTTPATPDPADAAPRTGP